MVRGSGGRAAADVERAATYRGSLSVLATLVMCFTFLCVVLLERPAVGTAVRSLANSPGNLTPTMFAVLAEVLVAPLLGAVVAYVVAAQAVALLRLGLYRRHLHAFTESWLRTYAPLRTAGVRLTGTRYGSNGVAEAGATVPFDGTFQFSESLLLLGEAGAGKTATLHLLAFELTRRRKLLSLYLGRTALPIVISANALQGNSPLGVHEVRHLLRRQLRRFGTKGLAARLPRMEQRGRIVVLCDELDQLPGGDRKEIAGALASLLANSAGRVAAIVTCDLRTYEDDFGTLAPLKALGRVIINDLATEDTIEALRRHSPQGGSRRGSGEEIRDALERSRLATCTRRPASLAALLALRQAGEMWPHGRGDLLRRYAHHMCGVDSGERPGAERNALLLGALAMSLRGAGVRTLRIPSARSMGREMVDWLDEWPPLTPTEHAVDSRLIVSPAEAESACKEALARGILSRTPDGDGLSFANSIVGAAFAAWWLDRQDDGMGRLNAELLQNEWALPVLLWVEAHGNPADLAARLYRLADTPESTATRAGLPSRTAARATTLALALLSMCDGLASTLPSAIAAASGTHAAEQHLRDLLDEMQRMLQIPDETEPLTAALSEVERHGGSEVAASVGYLAQVPALNRLVRAQLALLLGALASPAAVSGLVDLLNEPDPVLRQAVNAAVELAGAVCIGPLQGALRSSSERVRSRAEEALALLGDEAMEAAARTLVSGTGEQRAGAARTLGALRAEQAIEPLIHRLDDNEGGVRVAAARALGQIASGQALAALEEHATSPDLELRVAVTQALGQTRDPEALPALMRLLGDNDATVRAAAADALGLLGDERAVVALREHRDDPDPWAQHAVVFALRRLGKATG